MPLYCRFPSNIIGGRQGSQEPRLASISRRMLGPELGQCLGENRLYFKDSYVSDKVVQCTMCIHSFSGDRSLGEKATFKLYCRRNSAVAGTQMRLRASLDTLMTIMSVKFRVFFSP